MTLYTKTLALLRAAPRDITLSQIAADSGLELPWISRFKNERIKTPSVHHVQRLHDCLVAYGVEADA